MWDFHIEVGFKEVKTVHIMIAGLIANPIMSINPPRSMQYPILAMAFMTTYIP
jgi:hypothetical protein